MISALGSSTKSILLSAYLVIDRYNMEYIALVDSGCTGIVFVDFVFTVKNKLPIVKLGIL